MDALIFDKDGTLFDYQRTWGQTCATFIQRLGRSDAERQRLADVLGFDLETGLFLSHSLVIAGTSGEVADAASTVVPDVPWSDIAALENEVALATEQVAVCDLDAVLSGLGSSRTLGLVTNDRENAARAHLESVGILDHFAFVAGFDSGFGAKPLPGPLLGFCEATGMSPDQTIMVGDSRHDLVAGRAAGMGTIAVLTGVATEAELADLADVVLPDISHIGAYLAE